MYPLIWQVPSTITSHYPKFITPPDTGNKDSIKTLPYPFKDQGIIPGTDEGYESKLFLQKPSNIKTEVEYDHHNNEFIVTEKIGNLHYRYPQIYSFEEYKKESFDKALRNYWRQRFMSENFEHKSSLIPQITIPGQAFEQIFGTNVIDIKPQGFAELIFELKYNKNDNPALPMRERRTFTFDFREIIQMSVTGKIGDKLEISTKYNTEASFEFENKMKLAYEGKEDEIIKKIEAGNVSLPLQGSLITGSYTLFGIKTELQFGKLTVSNIFSQQKGKSQVIEVQGGAQVSEFNVWADQYEANKHFFIGKFFYDYYDKFLENLPVIGGGITITRMEVWVTNKQGNTTDTRNVVAFTDLGEGLAPDGTSNIHSNQVSLNPFINVPFPQDTINSLSTIEYQFPEIRDISKVSNILHQNQFIQGTDYEKVESMRMLNPSEYTYHPNLGYISLNSALNADEVLAIAYEYVVGGKTYRVGEFSNTVPAPNTLILKLIKPTSLSPKNPTWRLMMKNIYSLGAYQVNNQDFILDIWYQNDKTGSATQQVPAGNIQDKKLLEVLQLDNLNNNLDPVKDGRFDFIDKVTINSSNGRVIFPVKEPFGKYLYEKIYNNNPLYLNDAKNFAYTELYDSTQSKARQVAEKNKFFIKGSYKSASGSDISLNAMNIPQGAVVVTAGGQKLTENVDYTVDYLLGRVKIINQGILQSGMPIKVSLESQSLFNIQSKTLIGTHLNYQFNKDFNVGATILNLTERPLTQKVSIGDEPISNTIWGLNSSYRTDAPLITKLVDKLPFIETKAPSNITVFGEFAHFIPGHSRAIEHKKEGLAYIDDFEGSKSSYTLSSPGAWHFASVPQGQAALFPEANLMNNVQSNFKRARLAWYVIDPSIFYRRNSSIPSYILNGPDQTNHFTREIFERELWPNKQLPSGQPSYIQVLNLAYYPKERGIYNYTLDVDSDGNLLNPQKMWGGIMRRIETNDFEAANYEFIEFWLMDPFVYDQNHSGGYLYINLGDISEDVLRDGRKSFENGFPVPGQPNLVDTTSWGRVPLIQSVNYAFDNTPNTRQYQDIGLDGLNDNDERSFFKWFLDSLQSKFGSASMAYQTAYNDPSSDNYRFYRGDDYDQQQVGILGRYKKYNGLEGNSPTDEQTPEPYSTAATTMPNAEDINRDNTLSEAENYYQYRIELKPNKLQIGQNYIVDEVIGQNKNGEQVKWFQFKIPLSEPDTVVGNIQDFKSIRFMRMFLTGFEKNVILRFAKLDLVRGEWRKYQNSLLDGAPYLPNEPSSCSFDISAVNIEENGTKKPVNYVLPPGVSRVIDPSNPQLRQLNEQAMVLKVCELADGDARAAYKNINLDVRQYKKLQMYVHAEQIQGYPLNHNDVFVFVRLGSDYQSNYYEYEIPLKLTPYGSYDNENENHRLIVWPEANMFDFEFEELSAVKQKRNDLIRLGSSNVSLTTVFSVDIENGRRISVVGNPNLSNVKTVMIGIRNRSKNNNNLPDDGLPKCVEVWVNELRLSDFNEKGGWAANMRTTMRLADFGNVNLSGHTSRHGFGSIEKKVNERQKEDIYSYDVSSNLELSKFLPEKVKLSLPMFVGYSESVSTPQYNPLDPDIPMRTALDLAPDKVTRDSLKKTSQSYIRRKSLNFTNVRLNTQSKSNNPLNPSNFTLSYAYNDQFSRNINTIFNHTKSYRGSIAYSFNANPKNIAPFQKLKGLNKPTYKLIKDFNFYYMPSQFSVMNNIDRTYNETQMRNLEDFTRPFPVSVNKTFFWNRVYDLRYDITRSLKFTFHADNIAIIDEPTMYGLRVNKKYETEYEHWKDSIWNGPSGILNGGRTTNYRHNFDLNYTLPINKIPLFNWVSINARYGGTYEWNTSPRLKNNSMTLGNTIKNSNTQQFNTSFNMTQLYNKVPILNRINQKYSKPKKTKKEKETVQFPKPGDPPRTYNFTAKVPKPINHKLKTLDVTAKLTDKDGKEIKATTQIINENRITITTDSNYQNVTVVITGQRDKVDDPIIVLLEQTARVLMMVKSINITYTENNGTILPGYLPKTQFIGMSPYGDVWAPGFGFVAGLQDPNFGIKAANDYKWITTDSILNMPYQMTNSQSINLRATIEPVKNMRIEISANRTQSSNFSEYIIYSSQNGYFTSSNKLFTGSFSMTYNTFNTTFEKFGSGYFSEAFENFKNYRLTIAQRLASARLENPKASQYNYTAATNPVTGFPDGYGPNSQEVLIPAFLAAYSGKDASNIPLSAFPGILSMKPNWSFNFTGLTNLKFFKKHFQSITIAHAYRSTYSVNSFTTNLDYHEEDGFSWVRYTLGNFIPKHEINAVSISEQLSPLISIDVTMKNSVLGKIEIKRSRNLAFNLNNTQINEMQSRDVVIGAGYRLKDLAFQINNRPFKSDLNLRANITFRNDMVILRKLDQLNTGQQLNQITSGQRTIDGDISAEYQLGQNFVARIYFKRNLREPKVSTTFKTVNASFGISLKFTLTT